jgi:hypothetical protein
MGGYAQGGGYGAPPGGAMAAPGQFGAQGMGGGFGGGGFGGGAAGAGPVGQTRNPVMVLVISMVCCFYGIYQLFTMIGELKAYTKDESLPIWGLLVPGYGIYLMLIKVPELVGKAKQMAGSRKREPMNIVLYLFLSYYALAQDLNEVWDPNAG